MFTIGAMLASLVVVRPFRAGAATGQNGSAQTYAQVTCTAHFGSNNVQQKQDISVWAEAPDNVAPGEQFQVTFPSQPADLPSTAQGFTINSYKNLKTVYKVNGATVVASSGATDGPATINGNSTPAQTDTADPDMAPDIPGPIPPGHLVPPNSFAQVLAPNSDGTITISAVEVDTTANVQNIGDVPVTCPVPSNTLTTTQVGSGGTTTTAGNSTTTTVGGTTSTTTHGATSTTSTTIPSPGGNSLVCSISGTATYHPALTDTGGVAPRAFTQRITIKATLTGCSGGPSGLTAPITHGLFTAIGTQKIVQGAQRPTCASWEASSFSLPMKSTSRLQNGSKTVTTLTAKGPLGPIVAASPATFDEQGTVLTRGAFQGKPLTLHAVTNVNGGALASTCGSAGGVTTLRFIGSSEYVVGPVPTGGTTTTTTAPTTTTTAAPTTTAPTTTASTASTTTTTTPPPVLPPEVRQAVGAACDTLATTVAPLGVDLGPVNFMCQGIANSQGSVLLSLFLISPQLGCLALAGEPGVNNPVIMAACVTFATAIQPYSSQLSALIPQGFF
jgi:hypothetical protein